MNYLIMLLILSTFGLQAQKFNPSFFKDAVARAGGESGGGGDLKIEKRIKEIRDDILDWIDQGGASRFRFSQDFSYSDYLYGNLEKKVYGMKDVLLQGAVTVSAFNKEEENLSVRRLNTYVDGAPKVCKGYIEKQRANIVCSKEKFQELSEHEQYQQIHHEYAGLARLERNSGADSDYTLSSQLAAFLEYKEVLKLAVRNDFSDSKVEKDFTINIKEGQSIIEKESSGVESITEYGYFPYTKAILTRQSRPGFPKYTYTGELSHLVIPVCNISNPEKVYFKQITYHEFCYGDYSCKKQKQFEYCKKKVKTSTKHVFNINNLAGSENQSIIVKDNQISQFVPDSSRYVISNTKENTIKRGDVTFKTYTHNLLILNSKDKFNFLSIRGLSKDGSRLVVNVNPGIHSLNAFSLGVAFKKVVRLGADIPYNELRLNFNNPGEVQVYNLPPNLVKGKVYKVRVRTVINSEYKVLSSLEGTGPSPIEKIIKFKFK